MRPLIESIAQFLINNQKASALGVDIFLETLPNEPNNVVVIYEYAGLPAIIHEEILHRSVQIVVRNENALIGKQNIWDIFQLFINKKDGSNRIDFIQNERWGQISIRNSPIRIKKDLQNRTVWAFNLGITTMPDY